ncbi:MAG: hypothetical protein CL398_04300 [Acidiferrobacteraceae bacterium]|nr:hypothetical protein [Acidiferrobacteraceae bacterium]
MQSETIFRVDDSHVDRLNHLNHVESARLIELGRSEWLRKCGLYRETDVTVRDSIQQYGSVVVNLNYNYLEECLVGDDIRIITAPEWLGNKSYRLKHQIVKSNGVIALDGNVTSVIMDLGTREIIAVPHCIAQHF